MSLKITSLAIENTKRVRAVALTPSANGLTVIGGRNGQGKTSVLDAIAWALGGEKFRPSHAAREGSVLPPEIRLELTNGIVVERKGKNGALQVTDPSGSRRGQQLLDEFVEKLALNLPKFMEASDREKAETLLNIIGVGPQLMDLDQREKALYQERLMVGRIADQKKALAEGLPQYDDVPADLVSASELIRQQQDILARNAQRQQWAREYDAIMAERDRIDNLIEKNKQELIELQNRAILLEQQARDAQKSPREMEMESTAELEANIAQIDAINAKVRANMDRDKALEDAHQYVDQYNTLTAQVERVRTERRALLDGAELPLPGLGVEDGALVYNGQPWDCMSSSEQLRVATAIVRRLNPECGFVLMDKLEQMDTQTLGEFGAWLEAEGLQVIATRVSTGEECSIIIEDGAVLGAQPAPEPAKFSEGVF